MATPTVTRRISTALLALCSALATSIALQTSAAEARGCLAGTPAEHDADAGQLRAALTDLDARCPCASYPAGARVAYESCVQSVLDGRVLAATLARRCAVAARRSARAAVCGTRLADPLPCIRGRRDRLSCRIEPRAHCVTTRLGPSLTSLAACPTFTRCLEAADSNDDLRIARPGDSGACAGPRCGDGAIDAPEQCDDGNTVSFDGCSAACQPDTDCDPDGTYTLTSGIEYACTSVGPGEPPFRYGIARIVLSDHGREIDVLAAPGSLPPGPPLSCAGSPVDRSDATFTLQECFFVARVVAAFSDPQTLSGNVTLSHQSVNGQACTPNPSFDCPPVTYPFVATRE